MAAITVPNQATLAQPQKARLTTLQIGLLVAVMLLALFLRFYALGETYGNNYYAATVRSMMTSFHNWFFASAEPGGSVTVDKPPLGFWMQTLSVAIFGFNGWALMLPQALAGVASVGLLFHLINHRFGAWPALLAALALTLTPVAVSTDRNNTIDSQLVFVLLLAAWAFIEASERGSFWLLLVGAALVGIGFNIKMLQAFLPLPAFYAIYFFSVKGKPLRRLLELAAATLLLLVISLSWAVVVDTVPAENRPYIGSSQDNSVMELILGHNGASRIFGPARNRGDDANAPAQADRPQGQYPLNPPLAQANPQNPQAGRYPPAGDNPAQGAYPPAGQGNLPPGSQPNQQAPGGGNQPGAFSDEVGQAGPFRLLSWPLMGEIGWLIPITLAILPLALWMAGIRWPVSEELGLIILFSGWMLTEIVFFSMAGLIHAYYMHMLSAPLAAMLGIGLWTVLRALDQRPASLLVGLLGVAVAGALSLHLFALAEYPDYLLPIALGMALLALPGLGLLLAGAIMRRRILSASGIGLMLSAILVAPAVWSMLTVFNPNTNDMLPRSGPGVTVDNRAGLNNQANPEQALSPLVTYLIEHDSGEYYLLAAGNANSAAPYIIATGKPALIMGGFSGSDPVISLEDFVALVQGGGLRFVLLGGSQQEISNWVMTNCQPAEGIPNLGGQGVGAGPRPNQPDQPGAAAPNQAPPGAQGQQQEDQPGRNQDAPLYDCSG